MKVARQGCKPGRSAQGWGRGRWEEVPTTGVSLPHDGDAQASWWEARDRESDLDPNSVPTSPLDHG